VQNNLVQLINLCLGKNIPFVSYRLPYTDEIITWVQTSGQFDYVESFEEISGREGFVYAPFHRRTNFPIAFFKQERTFINDDIDDGLLSQISDQKCMYPNTDLEAPVEISKEEYIDQAEKFIGSFSEEFTKAVLSRVKMVDKPTVFNQGKYFIQLQNSYPGAFCHIINLPGAGTWIGASPETLFRMDEDYVNTISLAGTQPKPEKGEKIAWTEKEIVEQKIVTDYIEFILRDLQIESFETEKTYDLDAGNAVHLATRIRFNKFYLAGKFVKFIHALHPTPAICGFPKEKALDLILNTEKHNREYYSGFCGPLNFLNTTDLFVNLRCMKILPEQLALFIGGGLISHSVPESEWEETDLKAETLLSVL